LQQFGRRRCVLDSVYFIDAICGLAEAAGESIRATAGKESRLVVADEGGDVPGLLVGWGVKN
jgi:hypothetical protein